MNRLAIETAFETCSVALECDGVIRSRTRTEPRAHGRLLLPFIDEVLAEAGIGFGQLDALVVDRGPGSFTSLRIGLGVAQGLSLAHDLPAIPVSSLAMMAAEGYDSDGPERVLVAMDARMGEVYTSEFRVESTDSASTASAQDRRLHAEGPERLCAPADIPLPAGIAQGVGTAFIAFADGLQSNLNERLSSIRGDVVPDASALLTVALATDALEGPELTPVYLRDRVANSKR